MENLNRRVEMAPRRCCHSLPLYLKSATPGFEAVAGPVSGFRQLAATEIHYTVIVDSRAEIERPRYSYWAVRHGKSALGMRRAVGGGCGRPFEERARRP